MQMLDFSLSPPEAKVLSPNLSNLELLHSCDNKTHFINPKPVINLIFEHISLKLSEKALQLTFPCLAFDGFTLHYAADLFLIQLFRHRLFICAIVDRQDNWCYVEFIFKMAKRHAVEMNIVSP